MPINLCERAFAKQILKATQEKKQASSRLSLAELRQQPESLLPFAGEAASIHFTNMTVKARDGYDIPIRIFNDHLPQGPALIWYPGCGYLLPVFELNAIAASRIAEGAEIKVILVDHRLAPEYPLPKPIEDAFDVTQYIFSHAKQFKIDRKSFFIGGISSGAHCALTISQWARDDSDINISGQFLLNGNYDFTRSHREYADWEKQDELMPQAAILEQISLLGLSSGDALRFSPLLFQDFNELPKTFMIVGEYDAVRSDSEKCAQLLKDAGIDIEKIIIEGQTHNTILLREVLYEGVDPAKLIQALLLKAIANSN